MEGKTIMESLILKKQIEAYEEQAMAEKPTDLPKGMEGLASKQSEMLKNVSGTMRACIEKLIDQDVTFLQLVELPHKSYKRLMVFFWRKMLPYAAKTPGMDGKLYTGMVCGEGSFSDYVMPIIKEYYELDDKKEVEKELEKEIEAEKKRQEANAKREEEAQRRKEMSDKADAEALAFFVEKYGKEPTEEEKKDYKGDYSKARVKAMTRLQEEEAERRKKESAERAKAKRAEEKAKENALMEELAAIENDDERQIRIDSLADERFFATVKGAADMEEDEQDAKTEEIKAKIEKAVAKIRKKAGKSVKAAAKKPVEDAKTVNFKDEAHAIAKAYIYSLGDEKYPMLSDKDKAIAEIEPTILKRLENGESKESIEAVLYGTAATSEVSEETSEEVTTDTVSAENDETNVEDVADDSDEEIAKDDTKAEESNIVEFKKPETSNDDEIIRAVVEEKDKRTSVQMSIFDFI